MTLSPVDTEKQHVSRHGICKSVVIAKDLHVILQQQNKYYLDLYLEILNCCQIIILFQ